MVTARGIRKALHVLVEREVRTQLNVIFYGRKAGPRQVGQVRVRDKRVGPVELGNAVDLEVERRRRMRA